MLSARFSIPGELYLLSISTYIFCSLRDIHNTDPPVFMDSYIVFSESPEYLGGWGGFLSALWLFLQFLTYPFLYFMRTQNGDISSSAISLSFGDPTILYCRKSLNASKEILLNSQVPSTAINVLPLGMQWH